MKKKLHDWSDIGYTALIGIDENRIDFQIYKISGNAEDENGKYTVPLYQTKYNADTYDIYEAQPTLGGTIKWDACSHINFGDDGYIHLCGGTNWFNFMECIKRVWNTAIQKLPQEHSEDMFDLELFTNNMPPEEQNSIETIKWPVWFWLAVLAVGLLGLVIVMK